MTAIALFLATAEQQDTQDFLRDFALARQMTVSGFFAIENSSALKVLEQAFSLGSQGITQIIVDDPKTLALLEKDLIVFFSHLVTHNITLVFAKEDKILDTTAILIIKDIIEASKNVRLTTQSKKIKNALQLKKKKGATLGGKRFGQSPSEAYIVKQIVKLYQEGLSFKKICTLLDRNNIKTLNHKKWHPTTVKRILDRALS